MKNAKETNNIIPKQLQNDKLRFIKVKPADRRAIETDWPKSKNYPFDNKNLLDWIKQKKCYGVVAGYGNVIVIDLDNHPNDNLPAEENRELMSSRAKEIDNIVQIFPKTFTIKTPRNGRHLYFIANFDCKNLNQSYIEIKAENVYVIGPNSILTNGKKYEIILNEPIAEISLEDIQKVVPDYMQRIPKTYVENFYDGNSDVDVETIENALNTIPSDDYFVWIRIGMALKYHSTIINHKLYPLYLNWSKKSNKFESDNDCLKKWNSFNLDEKKQKVTIGTLFFLAKQNGWIPPIDKYIDLNSLWSEPDKKGNRKFLHNVASDILLKKFRFITIGEVRFEIYYFKNGKYHSGGDKFIAEIIENWTKGAIRNNDVVEVIGHIKRQTFEDRKIFENIPLNLVNFKNGILDLNSYTLIPHTPDLKFIQQVPHNFNPNADCKIFRKTINHLISAEDVKLYQEWMGYVLFERTYKFKKALILVGEGDTGKTTAIKCLIQLIGPENCSGLSLHKITSDKFAVANMYGKLLNSYDDLSLDDINDTGAFKVATGGGYVSAEKKFGECFEFLNFAKLIFATNKICGVKSSKDEAYYGRWLIIFFTNVFDDSNPDTDKNLFSKISTEEELSGMINFALEGYKRLMQNNKFSYHNTPDENKNIMESNSNSIASFVQNVLYIKSDFWISKQDLYTIYSKYVEHFELEQYSIEKFGRFFHEKATFANDTKKDCMTQKSVTGWNNIGINEKAFHTFVKHTSIIKNKLSIPKDMKFTLSFYLDDSKKNSMQSILESGSNENNNNSVKEQPEKKYEKPDSDNYEKPLFFENKSDFELKSVIRDYLTLLENKSAYSNQIQKKFNLTDEKLYPILKSLETSGDIYQSKPDLWSVL